MNLLPTGTSLALVCALAAPVWAQTQWDEPQYVEWVSEGQRLYDEATALPPEARQRRRVLLMESARAKLLAREMLRAALVTGDVSDLWADATGEYFNLSENLIVNLTDLEQCDAAELLTTQVEADVSIIPTDALEHLAQLRLLIDECRDRRGRRVSAWDVARYRSLVADADGWQEQAARAGGNPDARGGLLFESVWTRQQALDQLRLALHSEGQAPGLEDAVEALFAQYPPLIEGLVSLGFCDAAQRRLLQRAFDAQVLGHTPQPPDSELAGHVERCRAGNPGE